MIRASIALLLVLTTTGFGDEPVRRPAATDSAEEPANQPLISRPVKLVLRDSFDRQVLGPGWKTPKGGMQLANGALVGDSKNREHERIYSSANLAAPTKNLGLTCRIKLGTANVAGIGIGGKPKDDSGFVFAVYVGKKHIQLNGDTQGIDRKQLELARNEWHDVMIECVGTRVVVQVNGEKVLDGETPSIGRFPKRGVAFVVDEGTAAIDQIVAGEVVPK